MKIIILNGPPRSGKDTIGDYFTNEEPSRYKTDKFAAPIKASLFHFFNLNADEFNKFDNELKDIPQERLLGKSWRYWCKAFSEEFAKIHGGEKVFGNILADKLANREIWIKDSIIFITDSGFDVEGNAIVDKFTDCTYLIQLRRPGCSFDGDSRKYLSDAVKNRIGQERCAWLDNDGTREDLYYATKDIMKAWGF